MERLDIIVLDPSNSAGARRFFAAKTEEGWDSGIVINDDNGTPGFTKEEGYLPPFPFGSVLFGLPAKFRAAPSHPSGLATAPYRSGPAKPQAPLR